MIDLFNNPLLSAIANLVSILALLLYLILERERLLVKPTAATLGLAGVAVDDAKGCVLVGFFLGVIANLSAAIAAVGVITSTDLVLWTGRIMTYFSLAMMLLVIYLGWDAYLVVGEGWKSVIAEVSHHTVILICFVTPVAVTTSLFCWLDSRIWIALVDAVSVLHSAVWGAK
jgi:hypothetical protein